ncbi:hypothetical protein [Endozoicomonas sp. Mp262]|uniref:hypothetical protein n=1 Tax=Endozoicomonas sp. Mp262 TaxID=2919499 RepID=UPI0021DAB78E
MKLYQHLLESYKSSNPDETPSMGALCIYAIKKFFGRTVSKVSLDNNLNDRNLHSHEIEDEPKLKTRSASSRLPNGYASGMLSGIRNWLHSLGRKNTFKIPPALNQNEIIIASSYSRDIN